jgi:hypothetical protein
LNSAVEGAVVQYRWVTAVLAGPWSATDEEALLDALAAGQALRLGEAIVLRPFVRIERRSDRGVGQSNP